MMKYILCLFFLMGCSQKSQKSTLHNYPYFDGMDCPLEFPIDNEDKLKAEAKALNMKYVNYLHHLNKMKIEQNTTLGSK
jgi:GH18 family chitinase